VLTGVEPTKSATSHLDVKSFTWKNRRMTTPGPAPTLARSKLVPIPFPFPIDNAVATCSYREYQPDMGQLIGTSTGNCRNRSGVVYARTLAPWSTFNKVDDEELAEPIYKIQLYESISKVEAQLKDLGRRFPGQTLVFACFEDLSKRGLFCHRTWLASWLATTYAVNVPELGATRTPLATVRNIRGPK
jgi:hypothetical protein